MNRISLFLAVTIVVVSTAVATIAQQSSNRQDIWSLENDYWNYVKALDLDGYKKTLAPCFCRMALREVLAPFAKITTDWIKAHTDKGERMQSFTLVKADSQQTDNVYVTHYWLTLLPGPRKMLAATPPPHA